MTTNENVDLLIKKLREGGFNYLRMQLELEVQLNFGFRSFNLYEEKSFGNERMKYKLEFSKDVGGVYNFSQLTATYRRPVILDTKITMAAQLDELMSRINWIEHFEKSGIGKKSDQNAGLISQVYKDLKKLGASDDLNEIKNYYLLIYKHWPSEISKLYLTSKEDEVIPVYEKSKIFFEDKSDVLDAVLAYQILSGIYDDLVLKVKNIGISRLGIDVAQSVLPVLKNNPDSFELNYSGFDGDNLLNISVPCKKDCGAYEFNEYSLQVSLFPQIKDDAYSQVDLRSFENELKAAYSMLSKSASERKDYFDERKLSFFQTTLGELFKHKESRQTAIVLEMKYLRNIEELKNIVHAESLNTSSWITYKSCVFPVIVPVYAAANLLNGRPIFDWDAYYMDGAKDRWLYLSNSKPDADYKFQSKQGISLSELDEIVKRPPFPPIDTSEFNAEILNGYRASIILDNGQSFNALLFPLEKELKLYKGDICKMTLSPDNSSIHKSILPTTKFDKADSFLKNSKSKVNPKKRKLR